MQRGALLLLFVAVWLGVTPAVAAPVGSAAPSSKESASRASALFHESAQAYKDGRFQDAVNLLLRARNLTSAPVLLYDLGRAYEALGRSADAADAYTQYVNEDPNASDRKAVEGRIATLRRQVATQQALEQRAAAAPSPSTPSVSPATASALGAPPTTPAPSPPPPPSDPLGPVPWVVGGVGVVALGIGAVFGLFAHSRYDAADSDPSQASAASKYDDAKHDAVIANVALVTGAALVVGAGIWLLVRAQSPKNAAWMTPTGGWFTF